MKSVWMSSGVDQTLADHPGLEGSSRWYKVLVEVSNERSTPAVKAMSVLRSVPGSLELFCVEDIALCEGCLQCLPQ